MRVTKLGVIGAGVMGTGIAAQAASAGLPVVLLDIPTDGDRSSLAKNAVARALKARPAPFMSPAHAALITVGNTEDDLALLSDCDFVIEAIVEQLGPKQALYERLESVLASHAIIASNTSSIPIRLLTEGRSAAFKARFLGAHFFNPVRYLHLLELIPSAATDAAVLAAVRRFADVTLGKGVVIAKDAPGFIANRIGIHGMVRAMRLMEQYGLSIDEVDALTGAFIGRPKSATFRTGDIAGIDVLVHVTASLSRETGEDFALPDWVHQLVARGALGEKAGAGYYRKEKKQILTLDYATLEYRPQTDAFPEELAFLQNEPLPARLQGIMRAGGRRAEFLRTLLGESLHYSIDRTPEIAHDIVAVDRAMEWGFGWDMGPFRQADAIGLDVLRTFCTQSNRQVPSLMSGAHEAFYRQLASGPRQLTFAGDYAPIEPLPGLIDLSRLHSAGAVVQESKDAALLDMGDGVLLLEFRGKMNTISSTVLPLIDVAAERVRTGNAEGLVIGNADPRTFSAGANLKELGGALQAGDWRALDRAVVAFQQGVMSIRRCPFPVVIAPFGLTLGGACEMTLHADAVQAHAELYAGMPEVGVGLIPGGGGTKEMLFRFTRELEPYEEADPFEAVKRAFKLLSMGTVSTSAADARQLGLLRDRDRVTMNRDRLLSDAKARVLSLAPAYTPPAPMTIRVPGREALGNLEYAVWAAREAGYITAHDVTVGRALAGVLVGGDGPPRLVSEQDVLDLEREAFLRLLGTKETQERITHMLATGKPLRN